MTSLGAYERDGWPLQPNKDVSATRLHGRLDTSSQVTSTDFRKNIQEIEKHPEWSMYLH